MMKTQLDCIQCFVRQATEAVCLACDDVVERESLLRNVLLAMSETQWDESPPAMAQRIHRIIRGKFGCADPYRTVKDRMNQMALQLLPQWREVVDRSSNPNEAAVKLAIAGNLLDAGAKTQISADELPNHLDNIRKQPLRGDVDALFRAADRARCILYLADNAGEIVFDRLLIERLPTEKITVFVRGLPVINDATMQDALAAGLPEIVPVLDNGSDAPGTVLEECSREFGEWFERADLVVSKGQGNYETLSNTDKPIFFLFTVKCGLVARQVGEPVGAMVVAQGGEWR